MPNQSLGAGLAQPSSPWCLGARSVESQGGSESAVQSQAQSVDSGRDERSPSQSDVVGRGLGGGAGSDQPIGGCWPHGARRQREVGLRVTVAELRETAMAAAVAATTAERAVLVSCVSRQARRAGGMAGAARGWWVTSGGLSPQEEEFRWLLHDEVHAVLRQLQDILKVTRAAGAAVWSR